MPIEPPISSTSCFEMESPRPVPPYRRVVEASAWVKRSKTRESGSGAMPIPVSSTPKRTRAWVSASCRAVTSIRTWPEGVNLIAFPARFISTCRTRPGSTTPRAA